MSDSESRAPSAADDSAELADRLDQLTRALRGPDRDDGVKQAADSAAAAAVDARGCPPATAQAAARALSAMARAAPRQREIQRRATALDDRWDAWFAAPVALDDARALVADTRNYLQWVPEQTRALNAELRALLDSLGF